MDTRTIRWLALLLPLASAGADAAAITATFSGTITEIDTQLADGTFVVGEPVSGSFVIDSEAVDGQPLPNEASYDLAVTDISVEFGDYPATSATGYLFIRNGTAQADEFGVSAEPPSGAPVGGLPIYTFNFQLSDTTQAALSSDAIPLALDLADFDEVRATLSYLDGSFFYTVFASITSLTYTPVPEPGGAWLTAVGALVLLALGRRGARATGAIRGRGVHGPAGSRALRCRE